LIASYLQNQKYIAVYHEKQLKSSVKPRGDEKLKLVLSIYRFGEVSLEL